MRRPRRGCHLLLLLLLPLLLLMAAVLRASAVSLRRRDSLDSFWGREDDYYTKGDGTVCQKCPAGTYVAEECKEQNSSGRCEPCGKGEYMEYQNIQNQCWDCLECREDQVKLSPCQADRNTVCACRNGTFCPPEHPCEMCQKCRPRCPEGQVVLKPCTPDSDLQCGPAKDTDPYNINTILAIVVPILILTLPVIGFCLWKCCSSPGNGTSSSGRPYKMVSSVFRTLTTYRRVNVGAEDNATNEHFQSQQRDTVTETPVMPPSRNGKAKNGKPKRNLVPVPGKDPAEVLRSNFYTFAEMILKDDWKKFGRSLGLKENDIVMGTSEDNFFDMLIKWQNREGSKASVNTLLETLDRLHLGGVAENISSKLVKDGNFQYETS